MFCDACLINDAKLMCPSWDFVYIGDYDKYISLKTVGLCKECKSLVNGAVKFAYNYCLSLPKNKR